MNQTDKNKIEKEKQNCRENILKCNKLAKILSGSMVGSLALGISAEFIAMFAPQVLGLTTALLVVSAVGLLSSGGALYATSVKTSRNKNKLNDLYLLENKLEAEQTSTYVKEKELVNKVEKTNTVQQEKTVVSKVSNQQKDNGMEL